MLSGLQHRDFAINDEAGIGATPFDRATITGKIMLRPPALNASCSKVF